MNNSIFPLYSLDRNLIHWEDYLFELTPVEKIHSLYFKREDYFAPLGYGGINGAKLRQAIWLAIGTELKEKGILLSGTSLESPQLPMGAAVALHFNKKCINIIGATKPETCIKKPMVEMSQWFQCQFDIIKIAYNPGLRKRIAELKTEDSYHLEYGITLDHRKHPIEEITSFHKIGGNQVKNIPDEIEDLIIPTGSANSATSILLGLLLYPPKNLKRIHLIGIGPSKLSYLKERLQLMAQFLKIKPYLFNSFLNPPNSLFFHSSGFEYDVKYYDLHEQKIVKYHDKVPYSYGGINFHPTYEGKVFKYIDENLNFLLNPKTLFWIVGSEPSLESMLNNGLEKELGQKPKKVNLLPGGLYGSN